MSPFNSEIGGSIEHWNDEPGELWLRRLLEFYPNAAWLNPVPPERWMRTPSVRITQQIMAGRMFPLTYDGLDEAMKMLRKGSLALARH